MTVLGEWRDIALHLLHVHFWCCWSWFWYSGLGEGEWVDRGVLWFLAYAELVVTGGRSTAVVDTGIGARGADGIKLPIDISHHRHAHVIDLPPVTMYLVKGGQSQTGAMIST